MNEENSEIEAPASEPPVPSPEEQVSLSNRKTGYLLMVFFVSSIVVGIISILSKPVAQAPAPTSGNPLNLLKELVSAGNSDRDGIALVKIQGIIQMGQSGVLPGLQDPYSSSAIVQRIREFAKMDRVKAIVVHVNSPGGTVAASQEIYEELRTFKNTGKKLVVSMGDMAASGGYYVAAPADRIYANAGTLTGSIGVYLGNFNLTGLKEKIGVDFTIIKGGKYKDILSSWREMTDEERKQLQDTVDNIYLQFLKAVAEGRGKGVEEIRPLAEGKLYSGEQAQEVGLIDEVGTLGDAMQGAWDLTGLTGEINLIRRDPRKHLEDIFEMFQIRMTDRTPAPTIDSFLAGDSMMARMPIYLMYPGIFR